MDVDLPSLIGAVAAAYGVVLTDVRPILGGYDAFARTFEGSTNHGERYFIKIRVGLEPGIALSTALRAAGNDAVVAPILTLDGDTAFSMDDRVLLLYPFEPGENGFAFPMSLPHWRALGCATRRIHDTSLPVDSISAIPKERFVVSNTDRFLATLDDLLLNPVKDPAKEMLTAILQDYESTIRTVINQAEELGRTCQARSWDLVLCHADLHVGNVLVKGDGVVKIVDWDSPRLAPRECDHLFMCDGGILSAHGPEEEAAFFEGYGPWPVDPVAMAYYRRARAVEDFVAYTHEATDTETFTLEDRLGAVEGFRRLFRDGKIVAWAAES